jgi:FtsP/CotA-like multicopper oxidase with cupredoxin domain
MPKRREFLKAGLAAASSGLFLSSCTETSNSPPKHENPSEDMLKYLCVPDGMPDPLEVTPSPPAERFKAKLFVPPIKQPVESLEPAPLPAAHQLYDEHKPQKFYEIRETEFVWEYHPDPPYNKGSGSWGFDNMTPGPTYWAKYGEPVLVRLYNDLPPIGVTQVPWALPSTSTHLHNGHTASESDGNPQDWIDSGEFWDHHYGNFPSGNVPEEKLTTLWYHDHRLDFTAANVYAGLTGFYFLFDEFDSNDETAPPPAWGLPSGQEFDVPIIFNDVLFDENAVIQFNGFFTDGWLGDQIIANRKIRPYHDVKRRKYRFRILNGGPSRFYQFFLKREKTGEYVPFTVLSGDGNILPQPVKAESLFLSVAQRVDVIIDFSEFEDGERLIIENHLEQTNGKGPSGRLLEEPDGVLAFNVKGPIVEDPSRIPEKLRPLPKVDMDAVTNERVWTFDYDGGLWTVNGKIMDPNRIDALVEQDKAEIWTFRNTGNDWSHPVHCHFTEFLILEINGEPYDPNTLQTLVNGRHEFIRYDDLGPDDVIPMFMGGHRRDVSTILPNEEMKVFIRFNDFLGKHVMHCHNVVHEDHAMMIRWDIVRPEDLIDKKTGKKIAAPIDAFEFYGEERPASHLEARPGQATYQTSDEDGSFVKEDEE